MFFGFSMFFWDLLGKLCEILAKKICIFSYPNKKWLYMSKILFSLICFFFNFSVLLLSISHILFIRLQVYFLLNLFYFHFRFLHRIANQAILDLILFMFFLSFFVFYYLTLRNKKWLVFKLLIIIYSIASYFSCRFIYNILIYLY